MPSQAETRLCFVSWNTNGIKPIPRRFPQKFSDLLNILCNLQADIVFLQETHVGPNCYQIFNNANGWTVYFTVHSSQRKGVAILIRDTVPFQYIRHDEDYSGGYIVLFCRLYGELYTLVNIYNHHKDRNLLGRLKHYLTETAEGVLVVGGDFNTVLDPRVDRKPPSRRQSPLKATLVDFTESLSLMDTWSHIHADTNNESRFTWQQGARRSRIDMFFLREDTMSRVRSITVDSNIRISDHYPLVLKLRAEMQTQTTPQTSMLQPFDYNPNITPGKISGAETLSTIRSLLDTEAYLLYMRLLLVTTGSRIYMSLLPDTTESRPCTRSLPDTTESSNYMRSLPDTTESRPYMNDVKDYRTTCHALTESLKLEYNNFLKTLNEPETFQHSRDGFNSEYLTFAQILATRLMSLISFKSNICDSVKPEKIPQKIKWSFLKPRIEELSRYYTQKDSEHTNLPPPPEFRVLDCLLPKVQGSSEDFRDLLPDCPLAKAIFNLALKHLEDMFCNSEKEPRTRKYHKQGLPIHIQQNDFKKIVSQEFHNDSGIRLRIRWDTLRFK